MWQDFVDQALAWIAATDEPNARRIEASGHKAQRQIALEDSGGCYVFAND